MFCLPHAENLASLASSAMAGQLPPMTLREAAGNGNIATEHYVVVEQRVALTGRDRLVWRVGKC
eukprot:97163-Chlamydomonas_euryale.AAC.2